MEQHSSNNDSSSSSTAAHDHDDHESLISTLPKANGGLYQYQGFWYPSVVIKNIRSFQNHFKSHDEDVILATFPKTGTTWLKAIAFSIMNRDRYTLSTTTPLLNTTPHELVPFLELTLYAQNKRPDLSNIPFPRLLATHTPYSSLPESIKSSRCKVVYICRNPLDMIVSLWHFVSKDQVEDSTGRSIDELVESFCKGEGGFGPYWDHMLGYWRESLETPEKVMFLKFEDLKKDTNLQIKKLGSFIGFPFSAEEENQGVIEGIAEACSLRNIKNMEVNKTGKFMPRYDNKHFFRKGEVGDYVNHLSPSMVENINKVMQQKIDGSGLTFDVSN